MIASWVKRVPAMSGPGDAASAPRVKSRSEGFNDRAIRPCRSLRSTDRLD